jgi:RNA polymerase sigma factor (sigma-70 family)
MSVPPERAPAPGAPPESSEWPTAAPALAAPSCVPARVLGDDALARRISAGDERAFEELYRRYRSPLYRYCASMVGSPEEGEEALQAVMLRAYRTLSEPRREIAVRPWLYRVAHNHCLDMLRRRRATAALTGLEEERGPGVDEQIAAREDLRELRRDLAALRTEQRAALVLREMSGLSHAEIAQALDASPAAAKQLIHEARQNLLASRSGRRLPCEGVQRAISDGDGRVLRGGAIRGHLRACGECSRHRASIPARERSLGALVPPLAPAVAEAIRASVAGGGGTAGGGALMGVAGAGGGLAVKLAVIGTAAVALTAGVGMPLGLADRPGDADRPSRAPAPPERSASAPGRSDAAALASRTRPPVERAAERAPGAPPVAAPAAPAGGAIAAGPGGGGATAPVATDRASVGARADVGSATVAAQAGPVSAEASVDVPAGAASVTVEAPAASAQARVGIDGAAGASARVPGAAVTVSVPPLIP